MALSAFLIGVTGRAVSLIRCIQQTSGQTKSCFSHEEPSAPILRQLNLHCNKAEGAHPEVVQLPQKLELCFPVLGRKKLLFKGHPLDHRQGHFSSLAWRSSLSCAKGSLEASFCDWLKHKQAPRFTHNEASAISLLVKSFNLGESRLNWELCHLHLMLFRLSAPQFPHP